MFFEQMVHWMTGPYLGGFIDWYCENQDVLNTVLVVGAGAWLFFQDSRKQVSATIPQKKG
jgi:hypothetical protein